jgi:hypothetical protein
LVIAALAFGSVAAREMCKSDRPANSAAQKIYDEATRILASIKETKYRHRTDIDEKKGIYHCDCSGFCGYVLSRTVRWHVPLATNRAHCRRPAGRHHRLATSSR